MLFRSYSILFCKKNCFEKMTSEYFLIIVKKIIYKIELDAKKFE